MVSRNFQFASPPAPVAPFQDRERAAFRPGDAVNVVRASVHAIGVARDAVVLVLPFAGERRGGGKRLDGLRAGKGRQAEGARTLPDGLALTVLILPKMLL